LGGGRIYHAYTVENAFGGTSTPLVAKVHRTSGRSEDSAEVAREAWVFEHRLYNNEIAPRWRGAFGVHTSHLLRSGPAIVALMEHAGKPIPLEGPNFSSVAAQVVRLYYDLHLLDVVHNSASPKHWYWDGKRVRLIDFGRATIRAEADVPAQIGNVVDDDEFWRCAAAETSLVCKRLYG
jgi:hypothetical protein